MEMELALIVACIGGYALIAAPLDRRSIGPAVVFVGIGLLLSGLDLVSVQPRSEVVRVLASTTLAVVLFTDASFVRVDALRDDAGMVVRLLAIGLPLAIVLGTLVAAFAWPATPLAVALLIGSSLAPTDAALGQAVMSDRAVPVRIRRMLTVESGLNDGIATPVVLVAVALAANPYRGGGDWVVEAFRDLGVAAIVGALIGVVGGRALLLADARHWATPLSRQLAVLAIAATCYLVSLGLHGNGFIAAFVGGLAFGRMSRHTEAGAMELTESVGALLAIGVWTSFGLVGASLLLPLQPVSVVYALLSLTIIRMLPVALALLGTGLRDRTIAFIGWEGPRGLASVVFLIIGIDGLAAAGVDPGPFASTVAWTVLLSVVLHGLSSGSAARRFGRFVDRLPSDAEERANLDELPAGRRSWVHVAAGGREQH